VLKGRNQRLRKITPRALATAAAAFFVSLAYAVYAEEGAGEADMRPFQATREWATETALAQGLYPAGMAVAPPEVWEPYTEALVALQGWELETAEKSLRRAWDNAGRDAERIALSHAFAELYFKKAELKKALKYAEEALKLTRAQGDKKAESFILKDLSKIERLSGDVVAALEYSERGYELARDLGDPLLRAFYLLCAAELAFEAGDLDTGETYLAEAAPVFDDYELELAAAHVRFFGGYAKVQRGEYDDGTEEVNAAFDIYKKYGDRHSEAQALSVVGDALMKQGDFDGALENFMAALNIYRELDDRICEARALYFCAQVFKEWGQYDSALTAVDEGLEVSREYRIPTLIAACLLDRGLILIALGDAKAAEKAFKEARKFYAKGRDPDGQRKCDWAIGALCVAKGDTKKGLKALADVERRCVENDDSALLAGTYELMAKAYEMDFELRKAVEYRKKLVRLCEGQRDERALAKALSADAYTSLLYCNYDVALVSSKRAIALYERTGNEKGAAFNYRGAGVCYMRTGRYEEALQAFEKAAELHHGCGAQFELGKDYLYLGILAGILGNKEEEERFMAEGKRLVKDKKVADSICLLEDAFSAARKAGLGGARIYVIQKGNKTVIVIGK
jgi:tetratricopeptide (TPR) repeat protein